MLSRSLLALFAFALLVGSEVRAEELFVVFWNVENLFDTEDDPKNPGDDEFLPSSPRKWTNDRYQRKLKNLARVIREMNEAAGPDVLGVAEIENLRVLKDLLAELKLPERNYQIVHRDSPDKRGIDVALIYDQKKVKLSEAKFITLEVEETREVVWADLEISNKKLTVFVNHWPSRRNPEEHRLQAARAVRKHVDELLADDAQADFLVIGDFNDYATNDSLTKVLRARLQQKDLEKGDLYNSTSVLAEKQTEGTYVFDNKWEVIDHIVLSPGLLDDRNFRWKSGSTLPVRFAYQMFVPKDPKLVPRPSRTYSGISYHADGYSDHLPIRCILEY